MPTQFNFTTEVREQLEPEDFITMYDDETGRPYLVRFSTFIASVQSALENETYLTINE